MVLFIVFAPLLVQATRTPSTIAPAATAPPVAPLPQDRREFGWGELELLALLGLFGLSGRQAPRA